MSSLIIILIIIQVGKIVYSGETGAVQQQEQFSTSTVRKIFPEDIRLMTDEFSLASNISLYPRVPSWRGGTVELLMTAVILTSIHD